MKVAVTASLLAVAGFAAAQQSGGDQSAASLESQVVSSLPPCALSCFTQAIGGSGCAVTDPYCQCTTGAEKILKIALPCLCSSKCTASDLKTIADGSTKMCTAAMSAKGQTYSPPGGMTISEETCKQVAAASGGSYGGSGTTPPPSGSGSPPAAAPPSSAQTTMPAMSMPTVTAPSNKTNASTTAPSVPKFTGAANKLNYLGESAVVALMGAAMWAL